MSGILIFLFLFMMLLPLYRSARAIRREQEESAKRFTSQLHAVYDAVNLQRKTLEKLVRSAPTVASDQQGASPSVVPQGVSLPPEAVRDTHEHVAKVPGAVRPAPTGAVFPPSVAPSMPPKPYRPDQHIGEARDVVEAPAAVRGATPQQPPRVPSRFETAAKDVLKRIWNWIIVGEEHIPEGVSVEFAIASQWLLRIGIVLLVIGVGFFLKYSIENGLLSEPARVFLSVASGMVMLISGIRILGGRFHVMGQGLLGGGIATLYFSAFAASSFYHLISMPAAFTAMIAITVVAGFIAVRFHSILTAVLGVIGGYGTPVMLSTGQVNFPSLYGYLLVLGVGVLCICAWKRWPLLNYLSFVGNFFLVGGSLSGYRPQEHFWQVMPFLIAFFVLFSTMVFVYNLFNRTQIESAGCPCTVSECGRFLRPEPLADRSFILGEMGRCSHVGTHSVLHWSRVVLSCATRA